MILDELRDEAALRVNTDEVFRRVLTGLAHHEVRDINRRLGAGKKISSYHDHIDYVDVLKQYIEAKLWLHRIERIERIERDYYNDTPCHMTYSYSQLNRAQNLVADLRKKKRQILENL